MKSLWQRLPSLVSCCIPVSLYLSVFHLSVSSTGLLGEARSAPSHPPRHVCSSC